MSEFSRQYEDRGNGYEDVTKDILKARYPEFYESML